MNEMTQMSGYYVEMTQMSGYYVVPTPDARLHEMN